jgi:hypothetical protein
LEKVIDVNLLIQSIEDRKLMFEAPALFALKRLSVRLFSEERFEDLLCTLAFTEPTKFAAEL